jgi:hypothetical protein
VTCAEYLKRKLSNCDVAVKDVASGEVMAVQDAALMSPP